MHCSTKHFHQPVKGVKSGTLKFLRDKILFKRNLKKNTPVFIYQMGKVASKSVYRSLSHQYPGIVLHAHYFNPHHTDWRIRRLYNWAIIEMMPLHVISLTREPIGRNLSAFFQNFEKNAGMAYAEDRFSLEELKTLFLKKYRHQKPLLWFDKNIKENFDIDVYENEFPSHGYAEYSKNNIRLLVVRSEINDVQKVKVIREFLKLAEFKLTNINISADKEYASSYDNFKLNVKLPTRYLEKMCQSKYFNHFYEKKFIQAVKKKWNET